MRAPRGRRRRCRQSPRRCHRTPRREPLHRLAEGDLREDGGILRYIAALSPLNDGGTVVVAEDHRDVKTDLSAFLQRIGAESRGGHRDLIGGHSVLGDDREVLTGCVGCVAVEISARPVREKEFSGLTVSRVSELRAGTRVGLVSRRAAELDTVILPHIVAARRFLNEIGRAHDDAYVDVLSVI